MLTLDLKIARRSRGLPELVPGSHRTTSHRHPSVRDAGPDLRVGGVPVSGGVAPEETKKRSLLADRCVEEIAGSSDHVTIEYCVPGNFERRARELALSLNHETGCRATLIPSRDGAFEICVNGRRVFSKRASWRFPDADEILYHVASA